MYTIQVLKYEVHRLIRCLPYQFADAVDLLLIVGELLDLGELVSVQPLDGPGALVSDRLLVVGNLVFHLLVIDGGLPVCYRHP